MPCLNFTSNWPSLSWILIRVRNQTAILNFRRKSPDGEAAVTMSATEVLNSVNPARDQYVVLHGILKKLKTGRRRYFVLFRDGPDQSARLDYFESEKKFKARFSQPKRSIVLKSCFHINRRLDTKHKFVLALYTKDDCFCLVMDSESKMVQWLKAMTEMHQAATEGNGGSTYEHVWQVTMEKKGLAEERGIRGNYHLCLNENMLSLVRFGIDRNAITESHVDLMEFPLSTIRRCGDSHNYFYMEVGRFSAIGSGELWMGTEDPLIAQNMHKTIIKSIARLTRSRLGTNSSAGRSEREDMPPMRGRSCSANEASKPIMVLQRRQTHVGTKPCGFSPVGDEDESDLCEGACCIYPDGPSTPSTTCSSGGTVVTAYGRSPASSIGSLPMHDGIHMLDAALSASRTSTPLKVILAGTRSAPMAAFDHIDDEPESEYMDIFRPSSADGSDSDSSIAVPPSLSPAKPTGSALGRERCDSLPTRNRTSSETMSMPPPPPRIGGHMLRTASNFMRPSNSPPLSSSGGPMSPSAGCSESEGSSLSIDETDGFNSHSGTPDDGHQFGSRHFNASEKVIPEENLDECWMADNNKKNLPFTGNTRSPSAASLSLPIQSHSNVLSGPRKGSPAAPVSYMDRYSPCGSSPGDQQMSTGGYMLMSPGADLGRSLYTNSSGASSLAEDVYVLSDPPAAPEEYMDMMESSNRHRQQTLSEMSSAASSCSITSGTPSNDLRFGEFQLDKVVSIFTPEDDASLNERPARAYSVGSRSEHNKRKLIDHIMPNEIKSNRLRAFSVGAKVPRSDAYRGMIQTVPLNCVQQKKDANAANNNLKSSSVLTLSSSHKRTGSGSVIDPMDDLMEIDFTSSPSTSSITMEEDVCDSPVHQYSSSPLAKSQPMSVPAKKTIDDHHHVLSTGSRGIDPPNGYVPMRPTLHTSLQSNYIPMKSVRSPPYNSTAFAAPSSSAKSQTPVVASSPSSTSSAGRNNNSVTISDDYLPMSPSQTKNLSAPEGYMEMGWVKNTKSTVPTRPASTVTSNNPNNNEPAYSRQLQDSRPISMPININQGKSNLNNERKNISLNLAQSSSNHSTRVRCDSKDSGIVTPSGSHSTIFPFSPGSPNSQPPSFPSSSMLDENTPARKCLVDGSSGSLQLARDDTTPSHSSKPELAKILNTDVVPASQLDGLSSDYADMSLGSSEPKATTTFARKLSSARTTTNADYTLMHPFPAKKPLLVTINNNLSNATAKTNQTGFRPISNLTSPSASASPNTGYELLQVRPNSVNSEKVVAKTLNTSTRPNSVNSDRLTAANVTPTPSTTTSSSSSTSTLCGGGSKSQSPLSVQRVPSNESNDSQSIQTASSRPPSVSSEREIHYASLDLPPATSPASTERLEVDIELATESRANSLTGGTDSSTSPSSASAATDPASAQPSAFTYAQIDFIKSEQLKEAAKLAAAAIASSKSPNTSC